MSKKKGFIQDVFAKAKKKGTLGKCTGKKLGSKTCPKGSKAYNSQGSKMCEVIFLIT